MVASKDSKLAPRGWERSVRQVLSLGALSALSLAAIGCGYSRADRRHPKPSQVSGESPAPVLGEKSSTGGYAIDPSKLAGQGRKPTWGDLSPPKRSTPSESALNAEKGENNPDIRSTALPSAPTLPVAAAQPIAETLKRDESTAPPLVEPGAAPVSPSSRASDAAEASKNATIDSLLASAKETLNKVKTYQVRLRRRERVGGHLQPMEEVVLSVRRDPRAVRFEWPSGPHQGREVIYEPGANRGHILVHAPEAPIPRISLSPDNPLVTKTSRHPISEAGFETLLDQIETRLQAVRSHDPSAGTYRIEGPERPEPGGPRCLKIVRQLPDGQIEEAFFDPKTHLPALVRVTAPNGDLEESYRFLNPRLDLPELAKADAFDPDARWGTANVAAGLLERLSGRMPKAETTR